MPTTKLTNEIINAAILGFEEQKRVISARIAELRTVLSPVAPVTPKPRPKRRMSAAGRRAIARAQRKRWAVKKAGARK